MQYLHRNIQLALGVLLFNTIFSLSVFAETVSGGGYTVEQLVAPAQNTLTGNGYVLQQSSQQVGGRESGGGYTVSAVFGAPVQATSTPPPVVPPVTPPSSPPLSSGGYYVFPVATSTGVTVTEKGPVTFVGSTCTSRITFSGPIDYGLSTNTKEDVRKLETFLVVYEQENLEINGIYEKKDVEAVKRWQKKYKSFILDPMRLKQPTGTVYTLSQRQIERQTTKPCGEPVVVTSCPFFKEIVAYGARGEAVKKIQTFLNIVQGEKLPVSGVYGPATRAATKRFQLAYKKDFFTSLKSVFISGSWNKQTQIKANQAIGCGTTG